MSTFLFVVLQYLVSAKAGLVNYIDGPANVHIRQQVEEGAPIETYSRGHVEVLLNPGSFLRLGENSKAVIDSADLSKIAVHVVDGEALIEAAEIQKQLPIEVTTDRLRVLIVSPGVYRFSSGTASVIAGRLREVDSPITVKKGHQIAEQEDGVAATSVPVAFVDDLDRWSRDRSFELSKANAQVQKSYSPVSYGSSWMFSPFLDGFTFLPFRMYRSYYGYSFVPISYVPPRPAPVVRSSPPKPSRPSSSSSHPAGGSASHTSSGHTGGHGGGHHNGGGRSSGGHGRG
jgi:uncharacterized membrane protein YgcG